MLGALSISLVACNSSKEVQTNEQKQENVATKTEKETAIEIVVALGNKHIFAEPTKYSISVPPTAITLLLINIWMDPILYPFHMAFLIIQLFIIYVVQKGTYLLKIIL